MKVIIPVAGKATRLRPHTWTTPKALLNVAGKPMIEHLFDELKNVEVSEYIFITGYLGDHFKSYMAEKHPNFKCVFYEQKTMNGPAGAIDLAKHHITEPVLIVYVDTVFKADLSMIGKEDFPYDGMIWGEEVEDYQRFGVMITDDNDMLTKIIEKPSEPISKLANIGMYYMHNYKHFLDCFNKVMSAPPQKNGEYYPVDAFQIMADEKSKIKIVKAEGWFDCGKHETLIETNQRLLDIYGSINNGIIENSEIIEPVFIESGVTIKNSKIGPHVSIHKNSLIENSTIINSIINSDVLINNSNLTESVIGEKAVIKFNKGKLLIGADAKLRGE